MPRLVNLSQPGLVSYKTFFIMRRVLNVLRMLKCIFFEKEL